MLQTELGDGCGKNHHRCRAIYQHESLPKSVLNSLNSLVSRSQEQNDVTARLRSEKLNMRCTCCLLILMLWSAAAGCNNRMPMCIGSFSLYVHNKNMPGFTYWRFLFETAAKYSFSKICKNGLAKKCTEVRIFMRPGWNLQSKIELKSVQKFVVGKNLLCFCTVFIWLKTQYKF